MAKVKRKNIKRVWVVIVVIVLLMGGLIIAGNNILQVTTYNLQYYNLPAAFEGFKIIHLSDLHSRRFGKDNQKLINLIREKSPHIVVMTGDMVNTGRCRSP